MANTNKLQAICNTKISLVTGTAAIATAFLAALSVIPTVEDQSTTLLQASVVNLSSL